MSKYSTQCTYPFSWNVVSRCTLRKYPNVKQPNMLSIDLLSKNYDTMSNSLKIRTLKTALFPKCNISFSPLCCNLIYFVEDLEINHKEKIMIAKSKNICFNQYINVDEICIVSEINDNETLVQQKVSINLNIPIYKSYFENLIVDGYKDGMMIGRSIMKDMLYNNKYV